MPPSRKRGVATPEAPATDSRSRKRLSTDASNDSVNVATRRYLSRMRAEDDATGGTTSKHRSDIELVAAFRIAIEQFSEDESIEACTLLCERALSRCCAACAYAFSRLPCWRARRWQTR